jgi:DNA-binding CsgD family transcriptional regulator
MFTKTSVFRYLYIGTAPSILINLCMIALPLNPLISFMMRGGILVAIYSDTKSGLTLEDVIKIRDQRLEFQKGVAYPVLIVCPRMIHFEKAAIRYYRSEQGMRDITAAAILVNNWAVMHIARLFLKKGTIPIDIFFRKVDAVKWLKQQSGIGPIDDDVSQFEEFEDLLAMKEKPKRKKNHLKHRDPEVLLAKGELLTDTESKVAKLITEGKTSQEIADMLLVKKSTVHKHRQHINQKTGVKNVARLIHWLEENKRNTA